MATVAPSAAEAAKAKLKSSAPRALCNTSLLLKRWECQAIRPVQVRTATALKASIVTRDAAAMHTQVAHATPRNPLKAPQSKRFKPDSCCLLPGSIAMLKSHKSRATHCARQALQNRRSPMTILDRSHSDNHLSLDSLSELEQSSTSPSSSSSSFVFALLLLLLLVLLLVLKLVAAVTGMVVAGSSSFSCRCSGCCSCCGRCSCC